jgi:DNA ligase (NAD+)
MRFINEGYISDFADIFNISSYKDSITVLDGFGEKSSANLIASVDKARHRHPANFIYALCIPMIGLDAAKKLIAFYGTKGFFDILTKNSYDNENTLNADANDLSNPDNKELNNVRIPYDTFAEVDGIGPERSTAIVKWISEPRNAALLEKLLKIVELDDIEKAGEKTGSCVGLTFVITGDVHIFKNRDEFKAYVESQGGHVAGSVSGKTSYLVNNDIESTSSKNTKAKSLGIEIITEDTFVERFGR